MSYSGIMSALAFAPNWSGLYAAGSYSGGIAMYTEDTGAQVQGWLEGVEGGVTQVRDGHPLFRHPPDAHSGLHEHLPILII
jgi:hypothetical protein